MLLIEWIAKNDELTLSVIPLKDYLKLIKKCKTLDYCAGRLSFWVIYFLRFFCYKTNKKYSLLQPDRCYLQFGVISPFLNALIQASFSH